MAALFPIAQWHTVPSVRLQCSESVAVAANSRAAKKGSRCSGAHEYSEYLRGGKRADKIRRCCAAHCLQCSAVQCGPRWQPGDAEQSASTPRRECKERKQRNGLLSVTPVSCAFAELQLCFGSTIKPARPARDVRACTVSTSIQPTTSAVRTSCDIASKMLSKLMSADENSPPTPPRQASQSWSVTFSLRTPTHQDATRRDAMRCDRHRRWQQLSQPTAEDRAAEGKQLAATLRARGRTAPRDHSLLRPDPPQSCTD